jgi:hypothetical protein
MGAGRFAERGVRSKRPAWQKRKSLQKSTFVANNIKTNKFTNIAIIVCFIVEIIFFL